MLTVYTDVPPPEESTTTTTTTASTGQPVADVRPDNDNGFPAGIVIAVAIAIVIAGIVLIIRSRGRRG